MLNIQTFKEVVRLEVVVMTMIFYGQWENGSGANGKRSEDWTELQVMSIN